MAVPSALSSTKHCRLPKSTGNSFSSEQPHRIRVRRDVSSQMLCGRPASFLQFFRFNKTSPFRHPIEDGSSIIALPSRKSSIKLSMFSGISGSFLSLVQFERMRVFRDFNIKMLLGNDSRLLHSFRFNKASPVRYSMDEGNPFIAVPSKESSASCSILPWTSGNCWSFEQPERVRIRRDSIWMLLEKFLSFLQPFKFRKISFLRAPTDG